MHTIALILAAVVLIVGITAVFFILGVVVAATLFSFLEGINRSAAAAVKKWIVSWFK